MSTAASVRLQGSDMMMTYFRDFSITTFSINSDTSITVLVPPASAFGTVPPSTRWTFIVQDISHRWGSHNSTLVSIPAPSFSLTASSETATVGTAVAGYSISSTGGPIDSYSISPDISVTPSNGLSFNTTTGLISGTPTAAASNVTYTITGTNTSGSTSVTYRIGVVSPPVVAVPDPLQQSKISSIAPATAVALTSTPVVVTGSFVEKISAIQINGVGLATGSWTQTPTTLSFTVPGKTTGIYSIQIYNGSAPVMTSQNFTFTAPPAVPTIVAAPKQKVKYIRCTRPGHGTWIAYGVNPVCPAKYSGH
jgi:hypothetical protein